MSNNKILSSGGYATTHTWYYVLTKKYPELKHIESEAIIHANNKKNHLDDFYEDLFFKKGSSYIKTQVSLEEKRWVQALKQVIKVKKKWAKKGIVVTSNNGFDGRKYEKALDGIIDYCTDASLTCAHLLHAYTARYLFNKKIGTRIVGGRKITCF